MPYFSYHGGHSGQFCRHARGALAEVVEAAVAAGFSHYGLSEHCPRDRPEHLFPDEADLTPADLARAFADYAGEAARLREAWADRIDLLVGFETERLPRASWAARMRELRAQGGFEYVVGSVHDLDGEFIDASPAATARIAERCGGREAMQLRYVDALADLVAALRPEVVGHVDLIRRYDGPDARFSPRVLDRFGQVLELVAEVGAIVEVNARPARRGFGPVYPLPEILRQARRLGVGVTLGDDSHGPGEVGGALDASLRAIAAAGYEQVAYLAHEGGAVVRKSAPLAAVRPRSAGGGG